MLINNGTSEYYILTVLVLYTRSSRLARSSSHGTPLSHLYGTPSVIVWEPPQSFEPWRTGSARAAGTAPDCATTGVVLLVAHIYMQVAARFSWAGAADVLCARRVSVGLARLLRPVGQHNWLDICVLIVRTSPSPPRPTFLKFHVLRMYRRAARGE